jgi:beta-glucosidase
MRAIFFSASLLAACHHPQRPGADNTDARDEPPPPTGTCAGPMDEPADGTDPGNPKMSCEDREYCDPWSPGYTPDPAVKDAVRLMVGSMSLSEKADQMRGTNPGGGANYNDIFRTPDNTAKGVRGFLFRDGPNGVNLAAQLPAGQDGFATAFPVPAARAAAFDMDLEYRIGKAMGDETLASGNTLLLAPAINVLRHPAWGRSQEVYGEDSFVAGRMGTAFTVGVQEYVPACVKHYAANNIENGRNSANAQMDEQTLREMYTRHFHMVIRDSGVACVMAAYNLVNGKKATQNGHILDDLLRGAFGFQGFVLSDWWAMPPGTSLGSSDALKANAGEAINAGMDLELPWAHNYQHIEAITGPGRPVDEATITASATRILEQKYRFKIAKVNETPGLRAPQTTKSGRGSIENNAAHVALAQEAAAKGATLLKNANNTLPINRATVQRIAVIGAEVPYQVTNTDLANGTIRFHSDLRLGDLGSGRVFPDPAKGSGPFAGIREVAGSGIEVVAGNSPSLADTADFVVVVAGLTPEDEGEEYTGAGDRPSFTLDPKRSMGTQNTLIMQVAQRGKPMVVVLEGGSVIDMPWLASVPAVVMAWYPGMDGGRALGKLLFGEVNFSGKLPVTWPKRWADLPTFSGGTTTMMDYFVGYRWFDEHDIEPLYPFGHGLSYTTFEYSHLQVPCSDVGANGVVEVKVDIKNTGTKAGDEVAFLFVSYPGAAGRRPEKELRGFHRVSLAAGETKRITIPLRVVDLAMWDVESEQWRVPPGTIEVAVGPDAARLTLRDTFMVR